MTLQEIFDKSIRTIIQQGGPSIGTNGAGDLMCCYRNPEGRMCAAGPFISDEKYDPGLEGKRFEAVSNGYSPWEMGLIGHLQMLHDTTAVVGNRRLSDTEFFRAWKPKLRSAALQYGVEPTVLEEIPNAA